MNYSYFILLFSLFQETRWYDETTIELMAPTLLPELHLLKRVKSCSTFSWQYFTVDSTCHIISQKFKHLPTFYSFLMFQVKVKGPRYWELSVDLSKDTEHLKYDDMMFFFNCF